MDDIIIQLITAIIALIFAVVAYLQNRQKNMVVNAMTPGTVEAKTPAIVATLPDRTWKMTDSVKEWLTFDATPENKVLILNQIAAAEASHLVAYQIHFTGGYYNIEYGYLKGSAGNPSGK